MKTPSSGPLSAMLAYSATGSAIDAVAAGGAVETIVPAPGQTLFPTLGLATAVLVNGMRQLPAHDFVAAPLLLTWTNADFSLSATDTLQVVLS